MTDIKLVGRRRLPCGHQGIRPNDDDWDGFVRTCDTCHRTFTGVITLSEFLTEKLGRTVATIQWDDDHIAVRIDDARQTTQKVITNGHDRTVRRARVGGAQPPLTPLSEPSTVKPASNASGVIRLGPPR